MSVDLVIGVVTSVVACRAVLLVTIRMSVTMIKGGVDGMLVEVDGLDIMLVIVMVIKLVVGLMVDGVVFSLIAVVGHMDW